MSKIEIKKNEDSNLNLLKSDKELRRKVKRENTKLVVLALVLLAVFFYSVALFVVVPEDRKNIAYYAEAMRNKLSYFLDYLLNGVSYAETRESVNRYCCIVLCGASLAACGAVFQGVFRNILVSPTILGVQSGGTLANTLYVYLFISSFAESSRTVKFSELENLSFFQRNQQQLIVFAGCILSLVLVVSIANLIGGGKAKATHVILCGMIFSSLSGSFVSLIQYKILAEDISNERIDIIRRFSLGTFDKVFSYDHLISFAVFLIPGLVVLTLLSGRFNVMTLGEDQAISMGVNYKAFKVVMLTVTSFMTAVIISFCGQISFVGFIVPQISRRIVGPDYKKLLPATMLIGSIMMILVYDLAVFLNQTASMNLITSAIGSVMMIYAFFAGKGVSRAE